MAVMSTLFQLERQSFCEESQRGRSFLGGVRLTFVALVSGVWSHEREALSAFLVDRSLRFFPGFSVLGMSTLWASLALRQITLRNSLLLSRGSFSFVD